MSVEIKNKTILITGASGGLATDLIERLKTDNLLILISRAENKKIKMNSNCKYIQADITDGEFLERKISEILDKTQNGLDGIVNTAAIPDRKTFSETPYESIREVVDSKIVGFANTVKASLKYLNVQSSIVNLSSVHAYSTAPDSRTLYCAANAGVIGLTKALSVSKDLRHKTRVNVICPGGFITDEYKESYPDWEDKLKKGQILPIKDVSNVVIFLLSEESAGINGAEIKVEVGVGNIRSNSSIW